ncbi:MAG: CDP-alcohol phosphatidyltransferase family protein [Oleibacter sp.]|nr:CDP-alcohol phosphatidyltransferase family protein [Thalassolituus sp.]
MNEKLARLWDTKNKNDEWWSSFVTSPLAIAFNYLFVDIEWLTPNLLTIFSFFVAIIAAVFIISGGMVNFIIAAVLINVSHVLDCMDGQMARYRKTPSLSGGFYDKLTDQIQVALWFGAVGYAAYVQSHHIAPVLLAFVGVVFYNLRGYIKYVGIFTEMTRDSQYLDKVSKLVSKNKIPAGLGCSLLVNLKWLAAEQRKIFLFDEGVFIFMLSISLVFNVLIPMLWVFALSQVFYGIFRGWRQGLRIDHNKLEFIKK